MGSQARFQVSNLKLSRQTKQKKTERSHKACACVYLLLKFCQDRVFFYLLLHFVSEIPFLASVESFPVRLDYLIDFLVDLLKAHRSSHQDNVGLPELPPSIPPK